MVVIHLGLGQIAGGGGGISLGHLGVDGADVEAEGVGLEHLLGLVLGHGRQTGGKDRQGGKAEGSEGPAHGKEQRSQKTLRAVQRSSHGAAGRFLS